MSACESMALKGGRSLPRTLKPLRGLAPRSGDGLRPTLRKSAKDEASESWGRFRTNAGGFVAALRMTNEW